jgi:hypothetical protein
MVGTKRTEAFEGVVNLVPEIVSSDTDVAPWDGRYLGEQVVLDVDALLPDEADGRSILYRELALMPGALPRVA